MNRFRKRYAPLIVIAATLFAALAWSWQSLDASAASASDAAAAELAPPDLARLIESAATTGGIPPGSLIRIAPEPPRTHEGRPYQEQSTEVVFHAVTVEQIVRFLYALAAAAPDLRPMNLRLLAPTEGAQSGATWNAEIRLTRLTYAPATPQK